MISDHWPLCGLVVRTPRLELRVPDQGLLGELADVAVAGIHDPAVQPFVAAWTDAPRAQVARSVLQWQWGQWAAWRPAAWSLALVAIAEGRVIGTQDVNAEDFAVLREVRTGSWLGRAWQGRGYGTEMRAAVLELAFAGLDARYATSEAFADNDASYRVSRKLGYVDDGVARYVVRGVPAVSRRLRLDRAGWAAARALQVTVEGLEPCLPLFGV